MSSQGIGTACRRQKVHRIGRRSNGEENRSSRSSNAESKRRGGPGNEATGCASAFGRDCLFCLSSFASRALLSLSSFPPAPRSNFVSYFFSSPQQLRHENLVNLLDVFRRKKRLFLVFEFVDHTILDDLERNPTGLDEVAAKRSIWQVIRGIEFCHNHSVRRTHKKKRRESTLANDHAPFSFIRSFIVTSNPRMCWCQKLELSSCATLDLLAP